MSTPMPAIPPRRLSRTGVVYGIGAQGVGLAWVGVKWIALVAPYGVEMKVESEVKVELGYEAAEAEVGLKSEEE